VRGPEAKGASNGEDWFSDAMAARVNSERQADRNADRPHGMSSRGSAPHADEAAPTRVVVTPASRNSHDGDQ